MNKFFPREMSKLSPSEIKSNSPKETQEIAQKIAQEFQNTGGIIALYGDLGAGKTTFVQGFARALGILDKIISPTFVYIRQHPIPEKNRWFYHIDLYRLENPDDQSLGLNDLLSNPSNIVVIEWPENLGKNLPNNITKIYLEALDENTRLINVNGLKSTRDARAKKK